MPPTPLYLGGTVGRERERDEGGFWKVLEGLEGFGGCLEGFGDFGALGGFWRVLEGLECLRAGKRQL